MQGPRDEIELDAGGSEQAAREIQPDGAEEWFSASELQRDSCVELEPGAEAPTLGSVPSALACLEAWSSERLRLLESVMPVPVLPGTVVWVEADPPALAVDWVETLVDDFIAAEGSRVLFVVGEAATRVEARAWSRCLGRARGAQRGTQAPRAVKDDAWKALSRFRRSCIRYFHGEGLLEQTDRLVEVAEALRSWRRAEGRARRNTVVVVQQPRANFGDVTRTRLERLARDQGVAVFVLGENALAEASCDTVLGLERNAEDVVLRWSAPLSGDYGQRELRWEPSTGRLSATLPG